MDLAVAERPGARAAAPGEVRLPSRPPVRRVIQHSMGGRMAGKHAFGRHLERSSTMVTRWTGSTSAFALACATIVIWVATGPLFNYSNTWQLVINTGTTIITFLMVFLIQRAQNKDSLALHLKLNEVVAAMQGASNRLIDVESLTEHELDVLHRHYHELAAMAKRDILLTESHSIEEAEARHKWKRVPRSA
jgi:low affinity Fe/Cu permease